MTTIPTPIIRMLQRVNFRYFPNFVSFALSMIHACSGSSTASTILVTSMTIVPKEAANPTFPMAESISE